MGCEGLSTTTQQRSLEGRNAPKLNPTLNLSGFAFPGFGFVLCRPHESTLGTYPSIPRLPILPSLIFHWQCQRKGGLIIQWVRLLLHAGSFTEILKCALSVNPRHRRLWDAPGCQPLFDSYERIIYMRHGNYAGY